MSNFISVVVVLLQTVMNNMGYLQQVERTGK